MPITQERVIRLIEAADHLKNRLDVVQGQARHFRNLAGIPKTVEEYDLLYNELLDAIMASSMTNPELRDNLVREKTHFEINFKQNTRMRNQMRAMRAKARAREQSEASNSHTDRPFLYSEAPDEGLGASASEDEIGLDLSQDQNEPQTETPTDPVGGLLPAQPIQLFGSKVGKEDGG